jgi:polyisoprenoid-binding protein YceI
MPTSTALATGTWVVDPAHSEVGFVVRHLGLSKVRGRFNSFNGTLIVAPDPAQSTLTATVDLGSVDTNQADRDAHLKSTDFFNAEGHPQMTFTSTELSETEMTGDLTINGVTRPVTFEVETNGVANDPYGNTKAGFSAAADIKRSDFGVDFNIPGGLEGMVISDKVKIELEVQMALQAS